MPNPDRGAASVTLDTIIANVLAEQFSADYGTPALCGIDTVTRAVTDALLAKGRMIPLGFESGLFIPITEPES